MTLRSNRLYFMLTWLPLLAATGGVLLGRMPFRGQRPATTHAYGQYSTQQILERAKPLCRALAPNAPELRIECMVLPFRDSLSGRAGWTWEVTWSDAAAQPQGRILFDADTGQVEEISRYDPKERESHSIGQALAAVEARRWLERLCGPAAASWRMDSVTETASGQRYRFVCAHTRASLTLTADGQLIIACVR